MELTHAFTVPMGADEAFDVLTDIQRIAPCMPGASIDSVDGDDFTGTVKVKVGPMQVTYRGTASYAELDRDNRKAVIKARAQETRGSGTANATISASLEETDSDATEVTVVSNLAITGRPAQFGRGVMNEVGNKLLGQFADCLSSELAGPAPAAAEEPAVETAGTTTVGSNGSSAAASGQAVTRQAGAAPVQPASAATTAAATGAPSAAAATSGATPVEPTAGRAAAASGDGMSATGSSTGGEVEAIDLFEVAGPSIAKRIVPVAVAVLVLLWIFRRRRGAS